MARASVTPCRRRASRVDCLDSDPDRPITTGRVYNGSHKLPYALPEHQTQSGIKSRSSPGGGSAYYNELRFEDKTGQELLTLHAERDQSIEVEHDERHWVGHDRVGRNWSINVERFKTETIQR